MPILNPIPKTVPLICLSNDVLLPGASMKIPMTSSKNINMTTNYLLSRVDEEFNTVVGVVPYKSRQDFQVSEHTIGTAAAVIQVVSNGWPRKSFLLTVIGLTRIKINKIITDDPYPVASISPIMDNIEDKSSNDEQHTLMEEFKKSATQLFDVLQEYSPLIGKLKGVFETFPNHMLVDFCASVTATTLEEKWDVLKTLDVTERLKKVTAIINRHVQNFDDKGFNSFQKKPVSTIKLIGYPRRRNALDTIVDGPDKPDDLEEKLKKANLPDTVAKVVDKEFSRLKKMSPYHAEYSIQRNYLEIIAELPWSHRTTDSINVTSAKKNLDVDHYGMDKVKKRVIEFLAVRQLKAGLKGPILCFVGPPGVGKTSIGRSIANILNRQFHRISLGGVCHQSEIRGHRRTYVGAMPGRIIQALRSVSVKNPVILFDEVDKLRAGANGDPGAALLEVLDPEQNCSFVDHYLNIPFDLSEVLFIATANTTKTIPPALLDRMEIIPVSGYTLDEKKNIAQRHLLPKQLKEHGLTANSVTIPEEILSLIITAYTKEAGVRMLERRLAAVCRHTAVIVASKMSHSGNETISAPNISIDETTLEEILGPNIYEWGGGTRVSGVAGAAVGLCWTQAGGDIMVVEASMVQGGIGDLVITGQLGSVMEESVKLAINWVRSVAHKYGLVSEGKDLMSGTDVHIHFPAGSVGKEGPSAGITIAVALISLFSGIPVSTDLAMTGEITLRGLVFPVGGIKEKVISAHRAGIKRIILPGKCKNSLSEIPSNILDSVEVIFVDNMDEVIEAAFEGALVPKKSSILTSKI